MTDTDGVAPEPEPNTPGFLVVGVGASAGGLEAFMRLLEHIPRLAPLALVLVQHLARDQESMLPQLLAAKTELTVEDAVDGKRIVPGHAYVIRPNTHMSVVDGSLRVQPRPPRRVNDTPIDYLLDSMADQYREKAIGIVLSGGGSDGAIGTQRIHGMGGITFAQACHEASADSMPRSAIATGCVSMVLSAHEIAEELVQLASHPFYHEVPRGHSITPEPERVEAELQSILRVLRRSTGVDFTRYKTATIKRRIQRRMAIRHAPDLAAYLALLGENPEEAKHLHDDILIHVTRFFREPESFAALRDTVFPKLLQTHREEGPIRAWVPGCSSGEEAYSLAITLLDVLEKHQATASIVVFATDLSQRMIEQARAGCYPDSIASDVPPEQLRRYFVKVEGGYRVSTEVRERCVFARQDITRDPPFSKLDIVMCRNLLIYLSQPAQRKITELFHYALLPHGVLVLGRSETIGQLPELFSVVDSRWKIYQRKQTAPVQHRVDFGVHDSEPLVETRKLLARSGFRERREPRDFHSEANRMLLERYVPPLAIVDEGFRIVRTQGRTAPFLELSPGDASLDVMRMIRPALTAPLRSALREVRDTGISVRKEGVEVRSETGLRTVTLEVSRVGSVDGYHYLILFEEREPSLTDTALSPMHAVASGQQTALEQLQIELTDTRAELQALIQELEAANEELQSANEEILSSNEELQSTNEELDTAREELQATNEELGTVNDELQSRNTELSRANGDLLNLLDSVDIPIVMVTSDLTIRRFTHAAGRTLNLIPSDVGRPIGHIKPNIGFPELEDVLRDVIERKAIREREVQDSEGRIYLATIRPYTSLANRVDGAVLALLDVSAPLRIARETVEALIAVRDPILLLDSNLVVQRANQAFYDNFGVVREHTEGRSVFDLGDSHWDVPALRELLQEVIPKRRNFEGFVVEYEFPRVGLKKLLVDGRRIGWGRPNDGVILLIIREQSDG